MQNNTLIAVDLAKTVFEIGVSLRPGKISERQRVQRDQFLRVNNTKPLPRGLITELLPEVSTILPGNLAPKKSPAALCEMLSSDTESPFRGLIRRASTRAF